MTDRDPTLMQHYLRQMRRYTFSLVLIVDKDLKITYVGAQGEAFLGYEDTELDGKDLALIVQDDSLNKIMPLMERIQKGEDVLLEDEMSLTSKDGSLRIYRSRIFPVKGPAGDLQMCIYGRDVTEWQDSMYALELMNKKLGILGSATRHDVLNSLTGLFGYLELAEVKCKDENVSKFIKKAKGSADIIKKQIEFTRTYQEIGSKRPTWLSVSEMARLAYASLNERRLELEVDVGDLRVYADPMMEKVLHNLMDNAHRHAEGATKIRISFSQNEDGTGRLVVEDNGKGVSPDEKEVIFKRGYGRNTGYGLYMSKEVLGITGLDIVEDGEPGKGARFTITIPVKKYKF